MRELLSVRVGAKLLAEIREFASANDLTLAGAFRFLLTAGLRSQAKQLRSERR